MAKKANTTKQSAKQVKPVRTIDQMSFARIIAQKFGLKISEVISVIETEQKLTMEYVKMGYKVIKKNYITIEGRHIDGKKNWVSPLNGKTYTIEPSTRILVRVGVGFKKFIENKKMPDKLCRFVENPETQTA